MDIFIPGRSVSEKTISSRDVAFDPFVVLAEMMGEADVAFLINPWLARETAEHASRFLPLAVRLL